MAQRQERRRRNSPDDVLIISDDSSPSFVDLTQDSPSRASPTGMMEPSTAEGAHYFFPRTTVDEIVDLTSCGDTSPVMLDPVATALTRRSRRLQGHALRSSRWQHHSPYSSITSDSDEENEVQMLPPIDITNRLPRLELPNDVTAPPETGSTPGRKQVKCPVCMDTESQIVDNGFQLTSTICGHIFCNRCIQGSIQAQHRCPTCRRKLTMRQTHPIFL